MGSERYIIVNGKIDQFIADHISYETLKNARADVLDGLGIAHKRPDQNAQLIADLKLKLAVLDEWIGLHEQEFGS